MHASVPGAVDPVDVRDRLVSTVVCPGCGGMLAPDPTQGDPSDAYTPLRCLSCGQAYGYRGGVLDLSPPDRPIPTRKRLYPLQNEELDFYAFFAAILGMSAYQDTDLEDELYHLLGWMDPEPDSPILQLGVGQGEVSYVIGGAVPGSPLLALDDDLKDLAAARRNLMGADLTNVLFVKCDLGAPPLRTDAFTCGIHFGVLHGLPEPASHMSWVGRSLKSRGRLAGVTLARSTIDRIASTQDAIAAKAGLRFVPMEPLAKTLARAGWTSFRHEQPSNWMARFLAVRR
jgi:ubiquinone/menaquinone biosynthesis C-methylase UbiE